MLYDRINGAIIGSIVGDAYGSIVASSIPIKSPYEFPIMEYKKPYGKYKFLEKGNYTYCTQHNKLIIETVNNCKDNEDFPDIYIKNMIKFYLGMEYRGTSVIFQILCSHLMNKVSFADIIGDAGINISDYDKLVSYPLATFLPIGLYDMNYIMKYWNFITKETGYSIGTKTSMLYIAVILNKLIMSNKKLKWKKMLKKNINKNNINEVVNYEVIKIMAGTDNFKDAIILATNDYQKYQNEIGFIVGMIAGAQYGYKNIPKSMLNFEDEDKFDEYVNMVIKRWKNSY